MNALLARRLQRPSRFENVTLAASVTVIHIQLSLRRCAWRFQFGDFTIQPDPFQVSFHRCRIGNRRNDSHSAAAVGTGLHFQTPGPREQSGPQYSIFAEPSGFSQLFFIRLFRNNFFSSLRMRRKYSAIFHQVGPRRRHQGAKLLEQLGGGSSRPTMASST